MIAGLAAGSAVGPSGAGLALATGRRTVLSQGRGAALAAPDCFLGESLTCFWTLWSAVAPGLAAMTDFGLFAGSAVRIAAVVVAPAVPAGRAVGAVVLAGRAVGAVVLAGRVVGAVVLAGRVVGAVVLVGRAVGTAGRAVAVLLFAAGMISVTALVVCSMIVRSWVLAQFIKTSLQYKVIQQLSNESLYLLQISPVVFLW